MSMADLQQERRGSLDLRDRSDVLPTIAIPAPGSHQPLDGVVKRSSEKVEVISPVERTLRLLGQVINGEKVSYCDSN